MSKTKVVKDSIAEISNLLSRFETSIAGKSKKAVDAVKETPSPRSFVKSADDGAKASDELIEKQLQDSDLAKKSFESGKANVSGSPAIKDAQTLSNIDTLKNTTLPKGVGLNTQFVEPLNISNPMGVQPKVLDDMINPQTEATAFGKKLSSYDGIDKSFDIKNKNINPKILAGVAATGLVGRELMSGDDKFGPIDGQLMSKGAPASTKDIKPKDTITKNSNTDSNKQGAVQVQPKEIESVKEKHPQEMIETELNDHISTKEEELDYLKALKDAQSRERDLSILSSVLKAGGALTESVTGVKQTAGNDLEEYAKTLPANVEAQRAMEDKNRELNLQRELDNPNSDAKNSVNDMLKQLGQPGIPVGMSMAQYSKITGINANTLLGHIQNKRTQEAAHANSMKVAQLSAGTRAESKAEQKDLARDKFAQGLRQELTRGEVGKVYGNYLSAQRSTSALKQFAANPSAYSDYGSLMLGLKALQGDQSVVREAEVRMGVNATDLFSKFQNYTQRAMSGQSLQPHQRAEMAKAAEVLSEISRNQFKQVASPILNQANAEGINENILLGGDFQQQAAPEAATGATVKVQRISDGVTKVMSADKAAKIDTSKYQVIK